MAAEAVANGVDGLSNTVADWAAAEGETELATAIRSGGDAFESSVRAALDATACYGFAKGGAVVLGTAGCVLGPFGCLGGAILGALAGGAISPACHRAVNEVADMVESAWDSGTALGQALADADRSAVQCSGKSFATADAADCIDACEGKVSTSAW